MQVKAFPAARRPRVEMVPLIDMFFLLLVFFIYGVFSMSAREGILVDLPAAATSDVSKDEAQTVSVTAEGALFLNQRSVTIESLGTAFREARARQPEALVIINADRAARHAAVVEVLDTARQAGIQRVSFQTAPADGAAR